MNRRSQPRIAVEFPAIVRARDGHGRRCEQRTRVCNLSTTGLHLNRLQDATVGMSLFIVFHCALTRAQPGLTVAAHGIVRRVAPGASGSGGVAVEFRRYRCLFSSRIEAAPEVARKNDSVALIEARGADPPLK